MDYCDKGDVTLTTHMKTSQHWTRQQEYEPTEEEDTEFDGLWNLDGSGHLEEVEGWAKGKSKAFGKGKKGKGEGPLAIKGKEDGDGE